jgi:F-type H+-transporting ATPase subunit b
VSLPLLYASALIEIKPGMIFWTILTFVIVLILLKWKAWGPIVGVVEEREKQIQHAIDSAKRERAEAEKILAEQKTAAAEARQKMTEQMRKVEAETEALRLKLTADAQREAERLKQDAQRAIQEEKLKAVQEIKALTADLAIEVAGKLLGERLDDQKHHALAAQFIDQISTQSNVAKLPARKAV